MKKQKQIQPSIGKKCFACRFFSHQRIDELGRRAYAFKASAGCMATAGHCSFHDCDDATGNGVCESFEVAEDA